MKKRINYKEAVIKLLKANPIKISCIVPIYNEADRMGSVLDVLCNFTLFSELIIINDGSTDDTQNTAEKYAARYKQIRIYENTENLGKTKTIIKGIAESKGDLIVMIDADLIGLDEVSIYKMIYFVLNGEFDMTILDRGGDRMAVLGLFQSWTARLNGG